jgi:hypothetical protein
MQATPATSINLDGVALVVADWSIPARTSGASASNKPITKLNPAPTPMIISVAMMAGGALCNFIT